jgi:acyl-CoA synthetase (AMP-forming)/AMP-acid ligase II
MDSVDEASGFCPQAGIFHSKRSHLQLPISSSSSSSISGFLLQQSSPRRKRPDQNLAYIDASHGYAALSYGELRFLARKASAGLWAFGARPGDVLLLLSPNSVRSSIMFLASASIGVVFSALNPSSVSSEIAKHASISGAKFIATTEEILPKTEPLELPTIILLTRKEEKEEEASTNLSSSPSSTHGSLPNCITSLSSRHISFLDLVSVGVGFPPEVPIGADDTALLMFSSGTTGVSKCVSLSHKNLISHAVFFMSRETGIPWSSRVYLCILPMFHVYGLCTFCSAVLATGCPTVILPKFEMKAMLSAIEKYKVTHLPLVPPVMRALARSSLVNMYDLSSLHHVSVGAAPVSKELIAEFRLRFPNVHVMPVSKLSCYLSFCFAHTTHILVDDISYLAWEKNHTRTHHL